jgi:hypothetical protein
MFTIIYFKNIIKQKFERLILFAVPIWMDLGSIHHPTQTKDGSKIQPHIWAPKKSYLGPQKILGPHRIEMNKKSLYHQREGNLGAPQN